MVIDFEYLWRTITAKNRRLSVRKIIRNYPKQVIWYRPENWEAVERVNYGKIMRNPSKSFYPAKINSTKLDKIRRENVLPNRSHISCSELAKVTINHERSVSPVENYGLLRKSAVNYEYLA